MMRMKNTYPISVTDASGARTLTRVSDVELRLTAPEGDRSVIFRHHSEASALWLSWCCK